MELPDQIFQAPRPVSRCVYRSHQRQFQIFHNSQMEEGRGGLVNQCDGCAALLPPLPVIAVFGHDIPEKSMRKLVRTPRQLMIGFVAVVNTLSGIIGALI